MAGDRLFVDTSYFVARFNPRDQYHQAARQLGIRITQAAELWTTDAVLLELGAAFSDPRWRPIAVRIWEQFRALPQCRVASVSGKLLSQAMQLFGNRIDKAWSLADCASFLVMEDQGLTEALSSDHHFVQAGYSVLLLESPRP